MTRQTFIDTVVDFYELKEFCGDYDLGFCDDVLTREAYDNAIRDEIMEWNEADWRDVWRWLDDLPDDYDYYEACGWGEYRGLNEYDFEAYKDDVLRAMDNKGLWDEEDEEPEEPDNAELAIENEDDAVEVLDDELLGILGIDC